MVKINIRNVKHHTNVALLVDKPEFLKYIAYLREKWNITKLFEPDQYQNFYAYIWGENKDESRWDEFLKDIEKARRLFNRTPNFDKVIIYAVGFNEIPEHAYKSCYLKIIDKSAMSGDVEYVIVVTPYTTETEVKKELAEFKKNIIKGIKIEKDESRLAEAIANFEYEPGVKFQDFKGRPTIEQIRQWYWVMYGDVIRGVSKKLKTYPTTLSEWQKLYCPKKMEHETAEEADKCSVCKMDTNNIEQLLPKYIRQIKDS